ncbi:MAG: hypothetical protein HYW23_01290 [Candidatus Aenigmarchaeota archaeon]|nr:hypothetical protein [Candidatus Aenigmarchaeota archaeon]
MGIFFRKIGENLFADSLYRHELTPEEYARTREQLCATLGEIADYCKGERRKPMEKLLEVYDLLQLKLAAHEAGIPRSYAHMIEPLSA